MDERQIASAVDRWVREHRLELIEDLKKLLRIRSVGTSPANGHPFGNECARIADCFLGLGQEYGLIGENDDYYVASLLLQGKDKREVAILGHLDVVDAGDDWKKDAFQPWEEKGKVFGRGSLDNKGPLVTAAYALRCIKELGLQHNVSFRVIAGCDEEKEMRDIAYYLSRRDAPLFTLICDGAWPVCVGEKGLLKAAFQLDLPRSNLLELEGGNASNQVPDMAMAVLCNCCNEGLQTIEKHEPLIETERSDYGVKLTVRGKTAHCSTPANGVNAILLLLEALCKNKLIHGEAAQKLLMIKNAFSDTDGTGFKIYYADQTSGKTTCVLSRVELINQKIHMYADIRYPITRDGNLLKKQLEKQCERLGLKVDILSHYPPFTISKEDPLCKMLLEICERHLSYKTKAYTTGGVSYARFFPNSVPFGPAYRFPKAISGCGEPHAGNEGIAIDQLLEAVKVYVIALLKLDLYFSDATVSGRNGFVVSAEET